MMLSWLGEQRGERPLMDAGKEIALATDKVINDSSKRTRDLGGSVSTDRFGTYVADEIAGSLAAA